MPELQDISSILKSGVNDSTANDFQKSLDFNPSVTKPDKQNLTMYSKNRGTGKYEEVDKQYKYLHDTTLNEQLMKNDLPP